MMGVKTILRWLVLLAAGWLIARAVDYGVSSWLANKSGIPVPASGESSNSDHGQRGSRGVGPLAVSTSSGSMAIVGPSLRNSTALPQAGRCLDEPRFASRLGFPACLGAVAANVRQSTGARGPYPQAVSRLNVRALGGIGDSGPVIADHPRVSPTLSRHSWNRLAFTCHANNGSAHPAGCSWEPVTDSNSTALLQAGNLLPLVNRGFPQRILA